MPLGTKRQPAYKSTYRTLGYSARKRGIPITLTFEEFVQLTEIGVCYYCGKKVKWTEYGCSVATNLDRKDNSKGYSFDNAVVCCYRCNSLKSNFFDGNEFKAVMKVHEIWTEGTDIDRADLFEYLLSWKDAYYYE